MKTPHIKLSLLLLTLSSVYIQAMVVDLKPYIGTLLTGAKNIQTGLTRTNRLNKRQKSDLEKIIFWLDQVNNRADKQRVLVPKAEYDKNLTRLQSIADFKFVELSPQQFAKGEYKKRDVYSGTTQLTNRHRRRSKRNNDDDSASTHSDSKERKVAFSETFDDVTIDDGSKTKDKGASSASASTGDTKGPLDESVAPASEAPASTPGGDTNAANDESSDYENLPPLERDSDEDTASNETPGNAEQIVDTVESAAAATTATDGTGDVKDATDGATNNQDNTGQSTEVKTTQNVADTNGGNDLGAAVKNVFDNTAQQEADFFPPADVPLVETLIDLKDKDCSKSLLNTTREIIKAIDIESPLLNNVQKIHNWLTEFGESESSYIPSQEFDKNWNALQQCAKTANVSLPDISFKRVARDNAHDVHQEERFDCFGPPFTETRIIEPKIFDKKTALAESTPAQDLEQVESQVSESGAAASESTQDNPDNNAESETKEFYRPDLDPKNHNWTNVLFGVTKADAEGADDNGAETDYEDMPGVETDSDDDKPVGIDLDKNPQPPLPGAAAADTHNAADTSTNDTNDKTNPEPKPDVTTRDNNNASGDAQQKTDPETPVSGPADTDSTPDKGTPDEASEPVAPDTSDNKTQTDTNDETTNAGDNNNNDEDPATRAESDTDSKTTPENDDPKKESDTNNDAKSDDGNTKKKNLKKEWKSKFLDNPVLRFMKQRSMLTFSGILAAYCLFKVYWSSNTQPVRRGTDDDRDEDFQDKEKAPESSRKVTEE